MLCICSCGDLRLQRRHFLIGLPEQIVRVLCLLLRGLLHLHHLRIWPGFVLRRQPALQSLGQLIGAREVRIRRPVITDNLKRRRVLLHYLAESIRRFLALRTKRRPDIGLDASTRPHSG